MGLDEGKFVSCRLTGFVVIVLSLMLHCRPTGAQCIVNGALTYQTIDGFGVNINHRSWNGDEIKPVLDTMIGQGGFTLFRVVFDNTDWAPSNNTSQATYNSIYSSARFEKLWNTIAYLNQKRITNGIILNFQGPGPEWMGGTPLIAGYEPQWAQMITSLLVYARNTRHLQFNLVAPDNEPDLGGQLVGIGANSTQYLTMLSLLAQNLNSNGLSDMRIIGPDLAILNGNWLLGMLSNSVVMSKLGHFGLHSYLPNGNGSSGVASLLAASSYPQSTFWMTEFNGWCNDCYVGVYDTNSYNWGFSTSAPANLMSHLVNGASAGIAWDGFDSYYEYEPLPWLPSGQQAAGWSFYGLFGVDDTNAAPKTYTPRKNFYTLAQITAFVPPGSQRIDVSGAPFQMLAFYHAASGRVTLVGANYGFPIDVPITLQSLPAVTNFALYYTDPYVNLNQGLSSPVTNGSFMANVPGNCIFTLTGFDPARTAVSVQVTNPASGMQYAAQATIPLAATASTTTGSISNVVFFNGSTAIGASTNAPYGIAWSNVSVGTYVVTANATDTMGHTNLSPGVTISVAGPPAQIVVAPTNITLSPYAQQLFTATVMDAFGNVLSPQPAIAWQAGGGTINPGGWLMAGGNVGGPFAISAACNGLSNVTSFNIASNVNIAPSGIGYIWYNMSSNTANSPQSVSPEVNDGDTATEIQLLPVYGDGYVDLTDAYEGAGVIWSSAQVITNVVFINGMTIGANGTFDRGFQLQFTTNGSAWFPAGPQWNLPPAYNYNTSSNSSTRYVFSGGPTLALGARCVGMVNTGPNSSRVAYATEVQAYAGVGAPPPLQAVYSKSNGMVTVSWGAALTNSVLQFTTNLTCPWAAVTNPIQYSGSQSMVTINRASGQQYFFQLFFP